MHANISERLHHASSSEWNFSEEALEGQTYRRHQESHIIIRYIKSDDKELQSLWFEGFFVR